MATRVQVRDRRNGRVKVIRQAFKDAEAAAMEAFGLSPAGEGDQNDPDTDLDGGDDDNHIHVHVHTGEGGGSGGSTADDATPGGADPAADPNAGGGASIDERVAALEKGQQQILAVLNDIAGKGKEPPANDPPPAAKTEDEADPDAEGAAAKEDPEDDDKGVKTTDSAALSDSYQGVVALAELLAPGIRVPTFDAAMPRAKTVDRMCQLRRRALDMAYATAEGHELVNSVAGKTKDEDIDIAAMDCKDVAQLFKSSAGAKSLLNNRASVGDGKSPKTEQPPKPSIFGTKDSDRGLPTVKSVGDLNAFYAKFYSRGAA